MTEIKKRGRPAKSTLVESVKIKTGRNKLHEHTQSKERHIGRIPKQIFGKRAILDAKDNIGGKALPSGAEHILNTPVYTENSARFREAHAPITDEVLKEIEDRIAAGVSASTVAILSGMNYQDLQKHYWHIVERGQARFQEAMEELIIAQARNGDTAAMVFLHKTRMKAIEFERQQRLEQIERHHQDRMQLDREKFEQQVKVDAQNQKNDEFRALMSDAFSKMQSFMQKPDDNE